MIEILAWLALASIMQAKTDVNVQIEPISVPELGVKHRLRLEQAL